jgi:hypothetical protein
LTRGELLVAEDLNAQNVNLATTTAALAVGSLSVTGITLGSSALTANQYQNGYLMVVDGGGEGTYYKIREHDAGTASSADFTLQLFDPIEVASDANTEVSLVQNKYKNPQQSNTDQADVVVGVPNVLVPIGSTTTQYFWCQTKGYCPCFVVGTPAVGQAMMASATTAGQMDAQDIIEGTGTLNVEPVTGYMVTVGITGEVQVVDLQIQGL